jgi:hypothetical protein
MVFDLQQTFDVAFNLDAIFDTVKEALDGDLQAGYIIACLMAYAQRTGHFNPNSGVTNQLPNEILQKILKMDVKGANLRVIVSQLQRTQPKLMRLFPGGVPESLPLFSDKQIKGMNDLKRDSRLLRAINDTKKPSNIAFRNAITIADAIGTFGYVEAGKIGDFDILSMAAVPEGWHIEIPFDTAGDSKVCEKCRQLAMNGPYRIKDFPIPPHHFCRCGPGTPILVRD